MLTQITCVWLVFLRYMYTERDGGDDLRVGPSTVRCWCWCSMTSSRRCARVCTEALRRRCLAAVMGNGVPVAPVGSSSRVGRLRHGLAVDAKRSPNYDVYRCDCVELCWKYRRGWFNYNWCNVMLLSSLLWLTVYCIYMSSAPQHQVVTEINNCIFILISECLVV